MRRDDRRTTDSRVQAASRALARNSAVITIPIAEELQIDVAAAHVAAAPLVIPVCIPELTELGPDVKWIQAHSVIHQCSANFVWDLYTLWSIVGGNWFDATTLFDAPSSTGPGGIIHSAKTDKTKWGPKMRYELQAYGTGAAESGVVSCTLAIKLET